MTTAKVLKIDSAITDFLSALEWPNDVPAPAVDAILIEARVLLRFTAVAGAPPEAPADFITTGPLDGAAEPGDTPWLMISALGQLGEAWCRRHKADPGQYPTGIKAQIVRRLDMRTAARWLYGVQLAAALALSPTPL